MRKTLLLLFVSILISGQLLAQDSRIVYSEDFETADDVANWSSYDDGFTVPSQNSTGGTEGSGALELTDAGFKSRIQRAITVTAGYEYLLTFDVKTLAWPSERLLYVTLEGIDDNPKLVYVNDLEDFTTVSIGGTATSSSGHIKIVGENGSGQNKVWIDNITLIENKPFVLDSMYSESFETTDDIANWISDDSGFTTKIQNANAGVDGGGAIELGDAGFKFRIQRAITATLGQNYSLTMDVKIENWASDRPIYASIDGIDSLPKRVSLNNFDGLTGFTTITLNGIATGTSGFIRIRGENGSVANNVWVDNISLKNIDMNAVVWDGSEWNSGAVPTASENVIVDGALTVSNDLAVKNIEVTDNGAITIESGASLAIMESAAGNATIKRNTTGNAGYSMLGAPISGANISALSADYLKTWDGSAWSTPSGTMTPGVGYFVGYNAASPEVSLTGALVSGNQSTAVSTAGDGFNLVANPYAASISIASFLTANSNIDASVYFWNDGDANFGADRAGDYVTVNSVGVVDAVLLSDGIAGQNTTAANTDIGSMQGFMVHATSSANIDFTPLMQTTTAGANADDNFYRNVEQATLKLALSGAYYNEVLFGFRSDATLGLDRMFDAVKRIGNENFAFYSKIEEEKFAIQGLPELDGVMNISLGYKITEAGFYKLSIKDMAGIPEGYDVIASHNGKVYNITDESASLDLSAGQGSIELTVTNASAVLSARPQAAFKIYKSKGQLKIQAAATIEKADIQIFNVTGRAVARLSGERFSNGLWAKEVDLKSGEIYILKMQSKEGVLTQKFIY